ncbi:MAG: hypothetical protein EBR82_73735 [Caulobacteraceae bacterium]|nr:hypothetical protein [Caulobacteraceae bacterium]
MSQIIIIDHVKDDKSYYRIHMKNEYGDLVQKSKLLADFDKTLGYLNAMARIWASNGRVAIIDTTEKQEFFKHHESLKDNVPPMDSLKIEEVKHEEA